MPIQTPAPGVILRTAAGRISSVFASFSNLRPLLLLGVLLLTLIWGAALWEATRVRQERLADFRQDLSDLAEVLDQTLVRQLNGIDNALLILRHAYLENQEQMPYTIDMLRRGLLKGLDMHVTVIDADGYTKISTAPDFAAPVYLGDRVHFRHFAEGGTDQLFISEPMLGRMTKRWGIQLVRPILGPHGKFLGTVGIFIPPDEITRFVQSLAIGADTVMSVMSQEGTLLSRSTQPDTYPGKKMPPGRLAEFRRNARGFAIRLSAIDDVERGMAHRWLGAYPLLLVVARTPDNVYAEIHAIQQSLILLGGGASLLVLASLVLIGRSMRQRELAEIRLSQEHAHLTTAQRIAQLGSWELDVASGRLYWSDEVYRIFEIDRNLAPATYEMFLRVIHPDDREAVDTAYADSLKNQTSYSMVHRIQMADGRVKWVREQCTTDFDTDGKPLRSSGTVQDITDRKHEETELRVAATAFETQEGMFVTDENGTILRINSAFTDITGFTAADIVGKNPRMRSSGRHDAAFYAAMWDRIKATGAWKGEIWNRRKNGEIYPESVTITAVRGDEGTVTHYVATMHDITQRKAAEEQIQKLAFHDSLTHLPNRRMLQDRLQHAVATSARSKAHGALLFIDLDKFKQLNDTQGHDVGDQLLQQVAQRLQNCVRQSDTVARMGGDEFVVLLEALSENPQQSRDQADAVGQKILNSLNRPYDLNGLTHRSTPSIGATLFMGHAYSGEELLRQADLAMYKAKGAGRNALCFFDPLVLEEGDEVTPI